MEINRRLKLLGTVLTTAIIGTPFFDARATGGDSWDEPAPPLAETLDFLPGKSLGEIFLETSPKPSDEPAPDFGAEVKKISERIRTEPAPQLVAAADKLLGEARAHYSGGGDWCNLLHDVRDVLASSSANKEAAGDYIQWRIENKELFGFAPKAAADEAEGSPSPVANTEVNPELQRRAAEASGPLKAHWLYLQGALNFKRGDREKCVDSFGRVVKEFPKHPRAEAALFILARCAFSASRPAVDEFGQNEEDKSVTAARAGLRRKAADLFERYRKQYPHGRFEADALGWLGALAFDAENYLKALEFYIAQAETPGHPETLKSAVFMCERCLSLIGAKPDSNAAFALIARHPRIAMGFTYLVLSAPEADNRDGKFDQPAAVKIWRRTVLPRIAAEVAKQKELYKSDDWQPRYLALLAQSASAAGNQNEALQLTNLTSDQLERSDDLLMVRALAFQRAGKASDAIETYRKLLANFPNTPIAPGARLRLAFALQDNHQAGDAVAELVQLCAGNSAAATGSDKDASAEKADETSEYAETRYTVEPVYPLNLDEWRMKESAVYPNITGAETAQIEETIDTLLNFSPLPELASALSGAYIDAEVKSELRRAIAERYLAAENFSEAKKFVDQSDWNGTVANLEKLTAAASGKDQAEEMARVGDAWAEARGQLLRAPLDTRIHLFTRGNSDAIKRRANGRSIGLKNVDNELSERDELRHASRWWMNAARAKPGTPLAAQARWKALEAMPKLARGSEYAEQLMREINGESVSREIYQRLRTECPTSEEAKRLAAYWSFPVPPKKDASTGYVEPTVDRPNLMGYPQSDFGAFAPKEGASESTNFEVGRQIVQRVAALREHSQTWDVAQMAKEIGALGKLAHENFHDAVDATWINFFDDLAQFVAQPNITREMQKLYVNLRLDVLHRTNWRSSDDAPPISTSEDTDAAVAAEITAALSNPALKPVEDFLEFSLIGLTAAAQTSVETDIVDPKGDGKHATYSSRDYASMEESTRAFLQKYPRSPKREAALFVLARAVQGLSRPVYLDIGVPVPGTKAADEQFDVVQKPYQREPFDPKRVIAALDDYDREFPNGRYVADVRNFRGMALWRMHDWAKALELTMLQLDDRAHPELQPEAGVRLANIFSALGDPSYRADLLDAVRAKPLAAQRLKVYLDQAPNDRTHPLRYLVSYLNDQLKLKTVASNP